MKLLGFALSMVLLIGLSGCGCKMTMPYVMETDRVDQGLEGNRGYLKGMPPPAKNRTGLKRPWVAVDVDLPPTTDERKSRLRQEGFLLRSSSFGGQVGGQAMEQEEIK